MEGILVPLDSMTRLKVSFHSDAEFKADVNE
jgi:hypothetical protein